MQMYVFMELRPVAHDHRGGYGYVNKTIINFSIPLHPAR